jgi:hypothetical protein
MSPKDGKAGNAVPPTAPMAPQEADTADPGEVAQLKAEQYQTGQGKYGSTPIPPFKPSQAPPTNTSWIEVELVDEEGQPVPGERYQITLPDGRVATGSLNDKGLARVERIPPGSCSICFPKLDKDAWEPA